MDNNDNIITGIRHGTCLMNTVVEGYNALITSSFTSGNYVEAGICLKKKENATGRSQKGTVDLLVAKLKESGDYLGSAHLEICYGRGDNYFGYKDPFGNFDPVKNNEILKEVGLGF